MKLRRFQVVLREKREITIAQAKANQTAVSSDGTAPVGFPETRYLNAEHEDEVRRIFVDFQILDISEQGVPIDPNQSVYDREEAAVYLRVSPSAIDTMMKNDILPKSIKGFPMFHRSHLDKVWKDRMRYDDEVLAGRATRKEAA